MPQGIVPPSSVTPQLTAITVNEKVAGRGSARMIRCKGAMERFNLEQFNDTPLNALDEHPACPTCGGVLFHLLTVSSESSPQMRFFFEFSVFHCAADGLFYRPRPGTDGRNNDSGVRVPRKRPPTLNETAAAVSEPASTQLPLD